MKTITGFFTNVIVKQFYVINAGFFLFFFFIFFGVINGSQLLSYHYSLIKGMIASPVFMAVVWAGWLLYNIKCIAFFTNTIKADESSYIFALKALPPSRQWGIYLVVALQLYLPVFVYACAVIVIAFAQKMWLTGIIVLLYQLLMIYMSAIALHSAINKNNIINPIKKITQAAAYLYHIPHRYSTFLTGYIFNAKKMAFAAVKIFSLALLSVSFIRNGDHFDADFFGIFFQLILTGHAVLVFYCVSFNETSLLFSRNMPLQLYKTATMYLLTFCVLLLPELMFMLINNHGNLPVGFIIELYLTAIATLFFYTATLYACGLNLERLLLFVFVSFFVVFFLQKSGEQLLLLLGLFAVGAAIFWSHYYSFEKVE